MMKTKLYDSNDTMRLVGNQAIGNDFAVVEVDNIVSAYLEDPDSLRYGLKSVLLSVASDAYLLGVIHGKQTERKKGKMNYKEEIKKIIDSMDDQTILRVIYNYAAAGLKEEKERKNNQE